MDRRQRCLKAALELARRERDDELAGRILEQLRGFSDVIFGPADFEQDEEFGSYDSLEAGQLSEVLAQERTATRYPNGPPPASSAGGYGRYGRTAREARRQFEDDLDEDESTACDCPKCRRKRQSSPPVPAPERAAAKEEEKDPFCGLDIDPELQEMLDLLPDQLFEEAVEALKRGDSPSEVLGRILFGKNAPGRWQLRRRHRGKKRS